MLGTLFKVLIIVLIVLAFTAGLGLVIMAGIADTHDVKPAPIPNDSSLAALAAQWDYADSFRRPMEFASYRSVDDMIPNIPVKGNAEIHRSKREVVYSGSYPGVNYQLSYMLDRESFPPGVQIVAVYKFKEPSGKHLWKVYRHIHRCLAPYLLDRLGSAATS